MDAFVDERYPGLAINKGELEPEYFHARRGGKRKQEWKITHVKSGYGILTLKSKKEAENKLIAIGEFAKKQGWDLASMTGTQFKKEASRVIKEFRKALL